MGHTDGKSRQTRSRMDESISEGLWGEKESDLANRLFSLEKKNLEKWFGSLCNLIIWNAISIMGLGQEDGAKSYP